jgi:aldehyde dehydrogenase (NAD+)
MEIQQIIEAQRDFFRSNQPLDISFRKAQLLKLKKLLQENEDQLMEAIYKDFGKSRYETFITELGLVYNEITLSIKNISKWSRFYRNGVNLVNFPARGWVIPEPYGVSLVIGAWNYPIQLALLPAVSAIAAGNTVIIKPSELSANTSSALSALLNSSFPNEFLYVFEGGVEETTRLLTNKFDKIFFTGSSSVGSVVMQAAAKNLTPVTLELGGKSPAIILPDANIKRAVQRLIWGKFLNAGQTCVAPDFLIVHRSIESKLLEQLKQQLELKFLEELNAYEGYVRIINNKHYEKLLSLIDIEKVITGGIGNKEQLITRPTVMKDVTFEDAIMKEEIFGPLLPVIAFDNPDELISKLRKMPKPLSLYLFGKHRKTIARFLRELSFGGGMINEVVMHFGNDKMHFGGVGESGMGSYHGKAGFDTFTHFKGILSKPTWFEPFIKYPPYTRLKERIMRLILH